jgi:uncharacterized membrane-anchored protein
MDHPMRHSLAAELHARPFLRISGSVSVTHYAIFSDADAACHESLLKSLCHLSGLATPVDGITHYSAKWSEARQLKWERHTEFSTFTFVAQRDDYHYFSDLSTDHVPQEWLRTLREKRFVASRIEMISGDMPLDMAGLVHNWIGGPVLVGSNVMDGGRIFCDWTIGEDGFSRFLVVDDGFREEQGGRLLQRLYEIETYRMMALLALPVARDLGSNLDALQAELSTLMHSMDSSSGPNHDQELLVQLTHLAVRIESLAALGVRFGASRAYERLVIARIAELREVRISGMPTISEFMDRRLAPAMETCKAVWSRHQDFAARVARAVDLLRTRVGLVQEENATRLLESMNRTTHSQLRLQHAVEGLSVAAISYYVISLISVALRALHAVKLQIEPDLVEGTLIIPVVVLVLLFTRRMRKD